MHWFMVLLGGSSPFSYGMTLRGRYGAVRSLVSTHGVVLLQLSGGRRTAGRIYGLPATAKPSYAS